MFLVRNIWYGFKKSYYIGKNGGLENESDEEWGDQVDDQVPDDPGEIERGVLHSHDFHSLLDFFFLFDEQAVGHSEEGDDEGENYVGGKVAFEIESKFIFDVGRGFDMGDFEFNFISSTRRYSSKNQIICWKICLNILWVNFYLTIYIFFLPIQF